jgi:ribose transport system permease protein
MTEISAYVINGFLCGVAGLIWISRLGVGEPTAGTMLELEAIAMVVIGGTSISGGKGSVIGTFFGAAIIMIIANILNLTGVTPFTQQIVRGLIIIGAVMFDQMNKK